MEASQTSLQTKEQYASNDKSNVQCTKIPIDVLAKKKLTDFPKNEGKANLSASVLSNILMNKDKNDAYNLTYSKTSYRLVNEKSAEVDSDNGTDKNKSIKKTDVATMDMNEKSCND
ncbi:uncharacterized protein LOC119662459 [Teleopsis dalmanni]|nr:uncharacterized protein LOC119662459 [Teleopsis dalmanni]